MKIFGICIESSHRKGMGHLFRSLTLKELIESKGEKVVILINNGIESISILEEKNAVWEMVDLDNVTDNWEAKLINKHKIDIWINDRLDTAIQHSENIKKNRIKLISFDDRGDGAELVDINFGIQPFNYGYNLKGKRVFKGLEYLILNKNINKFKRERKKVERILVCLGGSDTYGVTIKVLKILKKKKIAAEIIIGPCFKHFKELRVVIDANYPIISKKLSLVEEFYKYDLAITGGGMTPFEANASGLPCIIVANELHEIDNGLFLNKLGSSVFAGYHEDIAEEVFTTTLDVQKMSRKGIEDIKTNGAENIYREMSTV